MAHPFIGPAGKGLRERVSQFVKAGLHRTAATNIIFVCGGEGDDHLRPKFIEYMSENMPSYRAFRPEAAQEDFHNQEQGGALNLSDFEELVSDLSLGIVLFAESPGSYAETGLFSALPNARKKTLVIMNVELQGAGSFLAFGPVAVISNHSRLGAALHTSYDNPNFKQIKDRIEDRLKVSSVYRSIGDKKFSALDSIEIMSLIWFFIDILHVCSTDDIIYIFNSIYGGHAAADKIRHILSVLIGATVVERVGAVGLVRIADRSVTLAEPTAATLRQFEAIRLDITNLVEDHFDDDYREGLANVD